MPQRLLRHRVLAPALLGFAYFCAASAMIASTRFGGGVACLWIATALLLASLFTAPRRSWPARIGACAIGSVLATGLFGFGWEASAPLAVVNMGEALIGAWLLDRLGARYDAFGSLGGLMVFALAAGVAAPLASAGPAAAIASAATGTPFLTNLSNWYVAHALGTLSMAPVFTMAMTGTARRWLAMASRRRLAESAALLALVAATTVLVFAQSARPLLFLPILPVILTTFRVGRLGAAIAVMIVAVIGGGLTMYGLGPVTLIHGSIGARALFFQFYLATTVLTALPVAADLARRRQVLRRLRESEAQLRLLTDNSTDIVMNLHPDGTIRYASPSIARLAGYTPDEVIGRNAIEPVLAEDRARVTATHLAALAAPETTQIVEYRAHVGGGGEPRWFETHTRGVTDEEGRVTGVVSAVRDVSHRKSIEHELARAASTDPLTGLANRRGFDAALARWIAAATADDTAHVAVFDLDHFKRVNDHHGHAAGDEVLRAFADIARSCVRDGDMVARLGGEEFGIILAGSAREQARLVCDRIRTALSRHVVRAGEASIRVTASAGVAAIGAGMPAAAAMEAADAALYRAKVEGRDRLRLAA